LIPTCKLHHYIVAEFINLHETEQTDDFSKTPKRPFKGRKCQIAHLKRSLLLKNRPRSCPKICPRVPKSSPTGEKSPNWSLLANRLMLQVCYQWQTENSAIA